VPGYQPLRRLGRHICHLRGSRGGRSSPHVASRGRPPRRQPMRKRTRGFKLIEQKGSKRPVGKKWGCPTSHGLFFRCLTRRRRLSQPQNRRRCISCACVPSLPFFRRILGTWSMCLLDRPRLLLRRVSWPATLSTIAGVYMQVLSASRGVP